MVNHQLKIFFRYESNKRLRNVSKPNGIENRHGYCWGKIKIIA